ncbi:Protein DETOXIFICATION 45, chloroplastic [Stylosanthes scabra]|uniref:Protein DETOXIFICATION 45, chloroplastic n=1 Tax=Stylosanthes scabra TaxID=79078 RepID=A0ABU6XM31_9FABA|nr:Protein DETOXIFICATION 45, chloroplastic [Stylosanthes scabra]
MNATQLRSAAVYHGLTTARRTSTPIRRVALSYSSSSRLSATTSPFITLCAKPASPIQFTYPHDHHDDVPAPALQSPENENTDSDSDYDVRREIAVLTLPALAGQAIDPMAQLMETAYIGRLGTVELASAGVSVTIFNIISKLFNIPLLSVATSFVAEDIAKTATQQYVSDHTALQNIGNAKSFQTANQRQQFSSVSTALLLALGIGIFEALALFLGSGIFLNLIGVSKENPIHTLALQFLSLRSVGAPAVVLSLALQGIFRGFKDTKTPVLCLGKCLV